MSSNFINLVKEVLETPENLDSDQIQKLIAETGDYFLFLEQMMRSGDAQEQDAALASALELKQFLESKINVFSPMPGKEPTEEEQAMISEINKELKPIKVS